MTSQINPADIDGNYPIAGVSNNTQGMRDNFTNTRTNFQYAADEIDDLQAKAVLKAALSGTTLDNNLANNVVYNAQIKGISGTVVAIANTSGTITIDCSAGHYQSINMAGNIALSFTSNTWPTAGTLGMLRTQITVDQVGRTLTLPNTVSNGIVGIQGYSSNVITFANTGTYEFGFSTTNAGNAITIVDLNRPLSYYTNDVTMAGNLSVTGNIVGNVSTAGLITATGNITGGNLQTVGLITATGNITGGNVLGGANVNATTHTGTTVSVSGNVTGGNINGFMYPSAGTTSAPSLKFTAGSVLNTPAAGVLEYDGTVFYATLKASQRGQLQSQFLRVQVLVNTLSDTTSAQQVFSTPGYVSLAASTTYEFEAVYYITRAAGTTSHTTSTLFNVSSALLNIAYTADVTTSTGVALTAVSRIYGTAATALVVTGASSSATENLVITLKGIMRTSAATDVTPQFQYSAAPGGAPTVLTNSYIKLIPLGTSSVISVGPWT